jgi:hypothetical protein
MIRKIFMQRGLLLLMSMLAVLALTVTPAPAASTWQPVGSTDFTGVYQAGAGESLFVYNGAPYLAYEDADDRAAVMEYTGGSWQLVGGAPASSGMAASDSLFVYDGTPYVLCNDIKGGLTVMEYTGTGATGWQPVGSPDFANELDDPFLALPSLYNDNGQYVDNGWGQSLFVYDGIPYVAYQDRANGDKATVMEYTGSGATGWQPVGSPGFSSNYTRSESLFVYNGTPYVAYDDYYNGIGNGPRFDFNICKTTVMEYTGSGATGWQPVGSPDFSSGLSSSDSLYVSNGTPYLAYSDRSNGAVATVMEYTGGSWQTVGGAVDSVGTANGETIFSFPGTSLLVFNSTPYVAFTDVANGEATVMEYTGGSWQTVGGASSSSGQAYDESLSVSNGTLYVAYESNGATVMEYTGATLASSIEPAIQVNINGSPLPMAVPPTIVNGRVMVPLRAIFEALGATVQWNPVDQSIVATKGNTAIRLQIGSTAAFNNGVQVTLDAAPQIEGGRTLVPVRFVGEALGAEVTWDGTNRQVNIVTAGP